MPYVSAERAFVTDVQTFLSNVRTFLSDVQAFLADLQAFHSDAWMCVADERSFVRARELVRTDDYRNTPESADCGN